MKDQKNRYHRTNSQNLGEHIDLSNSPMLRHMESTQNSLENELGDHLESREFLGINFDCCKVYARIYINDEETMYIGNCPRCGKLVQIEIDNENGTDSRFFDVY